LKRLRQRKLWKKRMPTIKEKQAHHGVIPALQGKGTKARKLHRGDLYFARHLALSPTPLERRQNIVQLYIQFGRHYEKSMNNKTAGRFQKVLNARLREAERTGEKITWLDI
jgi:hypothetical protein